MNAANQGPECSVADARGWRVEMYRELDHAGKANTYFAHASDMTKANWRRAVDSRGAGNASYPADIQRDKVEKKGESGLDDRRLREQREESPGSAGQGGR